MDRGPLDIPLIDLQTIHETDGPIAVLAKGKPRRRSSSCEDVQIQQDSTRNRLAEAAINGDVKEATEILSLYPKIIDVVDDSGVTALHLASRYVNPEVVRLLLKAGASARATDIEQWTPLHFASKYFKRDLSQDGEECFVNEDAARSATRSVIDALVAGGADVNARERSDMTPLHLAAVRGNEEAAARLIRYDADCDAILGKNGMTPLMVACVYGKDSVVEILFDRSSRIRVDRRRNTLLHIAAHYGRVDTIRLLMNRAHSEAMKMLAATNSEGKTPIQLAAEGDHEETVELILDISRKAGISPRTGHLLHHTAEKGYLGVLRCLIEKGAMNFRQPDSMGQLPLHKAAGKNHPDVVEYLVSKDRNMLEATETSGMTPVLVAATFNALDAVKKLIALKAHITISTKAGYNIISTCAKYNAIDVLSFVIEVFEQRSERGGKWQNMKKSLVNKADQNQETAMHNVSFNGFLESARLLYAHGASVTVLSDREQTPLHLAALNGETIMAEQLIEWEPRLLLLKDDQGFIPLHSSAEQGHVDTVAALIRGGSDLTTKNIHEETALEVAVKKGHIETVQLLINNGATVENKEKGCTTALHLAAEAGFVNIVSLLLAQGATIDKRDENGKTALDIAIEKKHSDVAMVLVSDPEWKKLLHSNKPLEVKTKNKVVRETPMRQLIKVFPEVARKVMDNCIEKEVEGVYVMHRFLYEFLDDTYVVVSPDGKDLLCDESPYDENDRLLKNTRPYCQNEDEVYKNHPLKLMAKDSETLLAHPLVVSLLKHKWNTLGRYLYYTALTIYVLFIVLFTVYIIQVPAPYNVYDEKTNSYVDITGDMEKDCRVLQVTRPHLLDFCKYSIITLSIMQLVKEFFQLLQRKLRYFSWENLMELTIYICVLLTVLDMNECSSRTGIRQAWQWSLAAVCSFLSWMNLLFLVRKLPRFGIYVVMFVDIVKTFSRFFIIFALFIVSFSISFFVLLQNRPEFSSISSSVLKTTVMMIGEFEFTSIFHGDESTHTQRLYKLDIAYPLFLFFSIVMTILLMNLLVGLAVDDIKSVQEKAVLKRLSMQVDLVLQVETSIIGFLRRRATVRALTLRPYNLSPSGYWHRLWKTLRSRFGSDEGGFEQQIESIPDQEDNLLYEQMQQQKAAIALLQSNVDVLYKKQIEVQEILKAISTKLDKRERL